MITLNCLIYQILPGGEFLASSMRKVYKLGSGDLTIRLWDVSRAKML